VLRRELETAIPQYQFDIFQAGRVLEASNWVRSPEDGSLVHRQTNEPFAFEVWARPDSERLAQMIADTWTAVGARTGVHIIPPERVNDRQYEALHSGPLVSRVTDQQVWEAMLHSRQIPSPANNWVGANRSNYANSSVDEVLDRLSVAIDSGGQVAYQRQALFQVLGDLPIMPLFWEVVPALTRPSVKGTIVAGPTLTTNIYEWTKDPE
jgi:ABC-type transport system substrate-binding protein